MKHKCKSIGLSICLPVLLLAALFPLGAAADVQANSVGLSNLGFEDSFTGWAVEPEPVADDASVVASEDGGSFDTYADTGITVDPNIGDYMLRLGTPKPLTEKQERGENTVKQTFTPDPDRDTILVSFRLLTWEHRGNDRFLLDLQDASGNSTSLPIRDPKTDEPIVITMPDGTSHSYSNLPIEVSSDVGKRGEFLDTGWTDVEIYGVDFPDPNTELTLVYSVEGTDNKAHATWAYFDDVNSPPVAQFEFYPEIPWEGDFIEFIDQSYDPDEPDDAIESWEWNIVWDLSDNGTDPDDPISGSDLRNPFFIPVDEGTYIVTLKVTDSFGATGEVTQTIEVDNAPPAVNALNVEVLEGEDATLFGRFIDPGWGDNHTAAWLIDGYDPEATVVEDNLAFMGTGVVTGTLATSDLPSATEINGTLQVWDNSGDSSTNEFTVTVVGDNVARHESNNNIDEAPQLNSDTVHLSYIQSAGDVDVYEIVAADGSPLPIGTEALITLQAPNDYDLVILNQRPETETGGFQMGGYQMGGFQMGGFQMGGFQMGGFQMGGFQMGGFQMGGFQMGAFQMGGYQMGGYQMGGFQMGDFQRTGYQMGGFQMGGFQMGGYQMGGYQMGAYQMGGFQMGGYQMGGYQMGGYQMGETGSAFYPLSQVGIAGTESYANDNIGGYDISLAELGLSLSELSGNTTGTVEVVGFSANRGLDDEVLLARVDMTGTRLFVVVTGANDAFSTDPYALQVETSYPLDMAALLLAWGGDPYPRPVENWTDSTETELHTYNGPEDLKTLFVTQRERLVGRYGESETVILINKFKELADRDDVAGDIISVPISFYEGWDKSTANASDTNYSSIDAANDVASQIRDSINGNPRYDGIQYLVVMGNDDIVPFHRDPDTTSIGNERQYALTSFLRPGSPIFYSLLGGYILTDDYLVDDSPILWQGRPSYVPDRSVARLVETPGEMAAAAQAFINSNGQVSLETALVTGYDFFDDGGQEVIDILLQQGGIDATSLMPPTLWDADDLKNAFLVDPPNDVNNINAHYTHYSAISASGFATDNFTDLLTSLQVDAADLYDAIIFTMGCHAGLNVPDEAAPDDSALGLDFNPQLDFAQAMNRAILVGSTGFGYGDDEGIGATEYLMGIFTEELFADGSMTVGKALVNAKQNYRVSTSTWTVYDNKSSIQFELYGLPQYRVEHSGPGTSSMLSQETVSASATLGSTLNISPDMQLVTTDSGNYYTADGDSQATAFRPIQPRTVVDLPSIDLSVPSPEHVHGALILSGNFTDYSGFDPVITRPTNEWELEVEEIQLLPPTFWPAELATINTLETQDQLIQTLVVIPGQFRGTGTAGNGEVIGIQRLWEDLELELLSSTSTGDYEAPVINAIELREEEGGINITVDASDESGIDKIVVLVIHNDPISGTGTVTPYTFGPSEPITISNFGEDDGIVIQVVDGAGNVARATGKGANLSIISVDAGMDQAYAPGYPVNFSSTVTYDEMPASPVFYQWNFGDGTYQNGLLQPGDFVETTTDDPEPATVYRATLKLTHTYDANLGPVTATLKIIDAEGGIGADDVLLQPVWDSPDDATVDDLGNSLNDGNLIGGYVEVVDGDMHIGIQVAGEITDAFQYRVRLSTQSGGVSQLKYDGDTKVTGLPSLGYNLFSSDGNGVNDWLELTFSLSDLNLGSDYYLDWSAQTQAGVKATGSTGMVDGMPDSGTFGYVLP